MELEIDVLIDDSPINLVAALEAGMVAATIEHPWNREVCEEEDVVCAPDWPGLAAALERRCSLRSRAA
jgi:FMN phosphatase YigB (HAD superfamily)